MKGRGAVRFATAAAGGGGYGGLIGERSRQARRGSSFSLPYLVPRTQLMTSAGFSVLRAANIACTRRRNSSILGAVSAWSCGTWSVWTTLEDGENGEEKEKKERG